MKLRSLILLCASAASLLSGCHAGGDFTGREYMPDMAHSIALEANNSNYSFWNKWGGEEAYAQYVQPRYPVKGTIARGKAVYHYENTDEGREAAIAGIKSNPVKDITKEELAQAKVLYNTFCGVCHGEKGDGNGVLWNDGNGPYPNAPASFLKEEFVEASEGRYYHAIMYGKGVMGAYKDKINERERWAVIHYIRSLQAEAKGQNYLDMLVASEKAPATAKETKSK